MNPRRIAVTVGVGAVAVCGAAAWWAFTRLAPEAFIDIDQAQLQARLDGRFPEKHCTLMVACLTLSNPKVRLADGSGRIGLSADVLMALGRRQATGTVAFSGVLRYVRYQGDFFLDDVQVDDFALTGLPPELVDVVKARGPAALRHALEGHPIYSIKDDHTVRASVARLAVRDVRVVGGKVRVTFLDADG